MRDTLGKDTESKKGVVGSRPRGNHNVFTHFPKDPNCEVCKMTKNNTSQVLKKTKARGWDCTFYKNRET